MAVVDAEIVCSYFSQEGGRRSDICISLLPKLCGRMILECLFVERKLEVMCEK